MFFLGHTIAWIAIFLGFVRAVAGFFVASFDDPADRALAASRYLGSATSGEAINQGMIVFVVGVVIGMLAKMGDTSKR